MTIVDETAELALGAADLQDDLRRRGDPPAAGDVFIAGAAKGLDERLVVADLDFQVQGITDLLNVDFL